MEIKSQWHGTRLFKNLPQTSENYVRSQEFSYIAGGNVHVPSPLKGAQRDVLHSGARAVPTPHASNVMRLQKLGRLEALYASAPGTRDEHVHGGAIPNRRTLETNQGPPRAGAQMVPIHRWGTRRTPQLRADRDSVP